MENRDGSGSGHGWSGAQTLFWNCEAITKCHAPHGAMNWAIGVIGEKRLGNMVPECCFGLLGIIRNTRYAPQLVL